MRTTLLIFLILFLPNIYSSAQITFLEGYYVNTKNDTIFGLIEYKNWRNNPESIHFKRSENASLQTTSLPDIQSFEIYEVCKFIKYTIGLNKAPKDAFTTDPEPQIIEESVMLKVLLDGAVSLLEYRDGNTRNFFYQIAGSKPEVLSFKEYVNANGIRSKNNNYQRQIWENLICGEIRLQEISKLTYTKPALVKFFIEYNECSGNEFSVFQPSSEVASFALRPVFGIDYSTGWIGNIVESQYADIKLNSGIYNLIGVNLEYLFNFGQKKWGFVCQPMLRSFYTEGVNNPNLKVRRRSIEFPLGPIYYMYLAEKNSIFININYNTSLEGIIQDELDLHDRNIRLDAGHNFSIRSGIDINRIRVELGYSFSRNIVEKYYYWNSKHNRISFAIGYQII